MPSEHLSATATSLRKPRRPATTLRKQVKSWSVTQEAELLQVGFGCGVDFPQYAALHTTDSFLRLNSGPDCDWGSSIILLPCFWEDGQYYHGAAISTSWRVDGTELIISFIGSLSAIQAYGEIRLQPPTKNGISCTIKVRVDGNLNLDRRASEAFKPVVVSSMHVSANQWDAKSLEIGGQSFRMPDKGWIVWPAVVGRRFALTGGNSIWKRHAPSLRFRLDRRLAMTGWKIDSSNPNDDNLAAWASADQVLQTWEYSVAATNEFGSVRPASQL